MHDVDGAVMLDERIARPFERIASSRVGELLDALAGPLGVKAGSRNDDAVEGAPGLDLLAPDPRPNGGLPEAVRHLPPTTPPPPRPGPDPETRLARGVRRLGGAEL